MTDISGRLLYIKIYCEFCGREVCRKQKGDRKAWHIECVLKAIRDD